MPIPERRWKDVELRAQALLRFTYVSLQTFLIPAAASVNVITIVATHLSYRERCAHVDKWSIWKEVMDLEKNASGATSSQAGGRHLVEFIDKIKNLQADAKRYQGVHTQSTVNYSLQAADRSHAQAGSFHVYFHALWYGTDVVNGFGTMR